MEKNTRTVLNAEKVFECPWFSIVKEHTVLANGVETDFYLLVKNDGAMVMPVTKEGKVVFVKQYRPGVEQVSLELPAGMLDNGEAPEVAVVRELLEETGYASDEAPKKMFRLSRFSGKTRSWAHLFLLENCYYKQANAPEPTEEIEVVELTLDEVKTALQNNEIVCMATAAACLQYLAFYHKTNA